MAKQLTSIAVLAGFVIGLAPLTGQSHQGSQFELVPKIVFSNRVLTCVNPDGSPAIYRALELFLMDPDGRNVQQLTDTEGCTHSDYFGGLSPDGKKIVFDSTRNGASSVPGSLFLMASDTTEPTFLTIGSSATWSSDSRHVAFHAPGGWVIPECPSPCQIRPQPGSPTIDSDIFVANVDDVMAGTAVPRNITNSPGMIDEDADWSPDGKRIAFTSDPVSEWNLQDYRLKEIFLVNPDGTGLRQLTFNQFEERAPVWSPDGSRIALIARVGQRSGNNFEICIMTAEGTHLVQLTDNRLFEGTMTWTPDGRKIIFQTPGGANPTLFYAVDADTTCDITKPEGSSCTCSAGVGGACVTQLTTEGVSLYPKSGQLRVRVRK